MKRNAAIGAALISVGLVVLVAAPAADYALRHGVVAVAGSDKALRIAAFRLAPRDTTRHCSSTTIACDLVSRHQDTLWDRRVEVRYPPTIRITESGIVSMYYAATPIGVDKTGTNGLGPSPFYMSLVGSDFTVVPADAQPTPPDSTAPILWSIHPQHLGHDNLIIDMSAIYGENSPEIQIQDDDGRTARTVRAREVNLPIDVLTDFGLTETTDATLRLVLKILGALVALIGVDQIRRWIGGYRAERKARREHPASATPAPVSQPKAAKRRH